MQHRIQLDDGWRVNFLSLRVATITRGNVRQCSYFGFGTKKAAVAFCQAITDRKLCLHCEPRKGRRLQTKWEVKAWGCSSDFLLAMSKRDVSESLSISQPRSEAKATSTRQAVTPHTATAVGR